MTASLENVGCDLTARARSGRLDPVIGRARETARVIRILVRKTKNNPVLIGDPGVGKTAVVEGLAQRIVDGEVPSNLSGATVFSLSLGGLLAGTTYRGEFEQRMFDLITYLRRAGSRRLLFIDELHLLDHAGRSEGGLDAGNLLKPLLARGEIPCIGATTRAEWQGLVAREPALERRFQPVEVNEPSQEDAIAILSGLRERLEDHHRVEITDDALSAAVWESARLAPDRKLPDRAVDLLDEACALARLADATGPAPGLALVEREMESARARFDLARYARLRSRLIPRLRSVARPRVDASAVLRACREALADAAS